MKLFLTRGEPVAETSGAKRWNTALVRHLAESVLERARLVRSHLGSATEQSNAVGTAPADPATPTPMRRAKSRAKSQRAAPKSRSGANARGSKGSRARNQARRSGD